MTDREMLMLAYGAIKAHYSEKKEITLIIEDHLFPKPDHPPVLVNPGTEVFDPTNPDHMKIGDPTRLPWKDPK